MDLKKEGNEINLEVDEYIFKLWKDGSRVISGNISRQDNKDIVPENVKKRIENAFKWKKLIEARNVLGELIVPEEEE